MTAPSHHLAVLLAVLAAGCTPLVEPTARDASELQPEEQADDQSVDSGPMDDAARAASAIRDARIDAGTTREAGQPREASAAPREAGVSEP